MTNILRAFLLMTLTALIYTNLATAAELTLADVASKESDGPDGRGNTADDTWQFWFELAHARNQFHILDRHSTTIPAEGIPRKVYGPPAGELPNPNDTVGWVYHSDWDGRKEGVWADQKAGVIMAQPYVEKTDHLALAISYKVAEDGNYTVSGGIGDLDIQSGGRHDGAIWKVQVAEGGKLVREIGAAKTAVGDGGGRPDSDTFEFQGVPLKKGQLVRLVIHPNRWAPSDLTRIDSFKVEME